MSYTILDQKTNSPLLGWNLCAEVRNITLYNYIPLSQVFTSDHSFVPSLRYEVGYNPLPELCFTKHKLEIHVSLD